MPDGTEETTTPAFDADAFEKKMLEALNKGLTAREKKFDTQLQNSLKASQDAFTSSLDERFAKFTPATPADGGDGAIARKPDDVALKTLQKQLDDVKKALDTSQREKDEDRQKMAAIETRRKVGEELSKSGVTNGIQAKHALNSLASEGRFKTDDEGRLLWVEDNGSEVEFPVGLRSWLKTDEGKLFLPPAGARGAGSNPGGGNGSKPTPQQTQDALWEAAGNALRQTGG